MLQIWGCLNPSYVSLRVAALPKCHTVSVSILKFSAIGPCLQLVMDRSKIFQVSFWRGKHLGNDEQICTDFMTRTADIEEVFAVSQHLGNGAPS